MAFINTSNLAGIQYVGLPGISEPCKRAVMRLVQCGDRIERALLLSAGQLHAFLLSVDPDGLIAIKTGFASGYGGEGPRTLASTLLILREAGAEIEEKKVDAAMLERLDASALSKADLESIESIRSIPGMRWTDYIWDQLGPNYKREGAWREYEPVMPWGLIDPRLIALAKQFATSPDEAIFKGFRLLEDTLRARSGINQSATKLVSQVFDSKDPKLVWRVQDPAELNGRVNLFTGAFMAFRNPRAHRELDSDHKQLWNEFLLLNLLFTLEAEAQAAPPPP